MSNSKRREEKKRREKKQRAAQDRSRSSVEGIFRTLQRLSGVSEPRSWPGAADPSLDRPDRVKYELTLLTEKGTGRGLRKQLESRLREGLLDFIPEIEHWGMEEFFWHGLPGNPWHPIDHFLQVERDRFPEAARVQLARWKEARIGCYEIGAVAEDLVSLREVDGFTGHPVGSWVRAIALNIGGVNAYGREKGKISVTYVAPWSPERNIVCAMGYGMFLPPQQIASAAALVRGMRSIQAVTFPLSWRAGKFAAQQCLQQWRERDWVQYMPNQVKCPFEACIMSRDGAMLCTIHEMLTRTRAQFEQSGLYYAMDDRAKTMCGATAIVPLDFDSPTAMAFAEYREFRKLAGPPPASRGLI
ncbi:MAG TPA: hypothetical protein VN641_14810 [Urbifossiella sp.]|nr:hypothetical protein [Urbifossiella sp.]